MIEVQCFHSKNAIVKDTPLRVVLCFCEHSENAVVQNANYEEIVRANCVRVQYAEMQFDTGERGAILQSLRRR